MTDWPEAADLEEEAFARFLPDQNPAHITRKNRQWLRDAFHAGAIFGRNDQRYTDMLVAEANARKEPAS